MSSHMPTELAVRTHKAITQMNLSWLMLCREMAKDSLAEAALRFGVEPEVAKAIRDSEVGDLAALADTGIIAFKPAFDVCALLSKKPAASS